MNKRVPNDNRKQIIDSIIRNGKNAIKNKGDKVEILGIPVKKRTLALMLSNILALSAPGSSAYVRYTNWNGNVELIPRAEVDRTDLISEIMKKTKVNENGKVVGIDVSESLSADDLEKLLRRESAIPTTLYDERGIEHNVSDLAGPVDFVMIKIGARGYGQAGNLTDIGDSFVEQARVCEKLGIPYGGYYYSTALTQEEAMEEIQLIQSFYDKLGDTKFDLMGLTLDVEQCDGSRLSGKDVTDVMASWANKAEEVTGKKIILYTGGRDVSGPERILRLDDFNAQLKSGPARIWTPGPRTPDGSRVYRANQEQINSISNDYGGNISIVQAILDQKNINAGVVDSTDIDIIDIDVFEDILREYAGLQPKYRGPNDDFDIESAIEDAYRQTQHEDMENQEIQEQIDIERVDDVGTIGKIRAALSSFFRRLFRREEHLPLPESKKSEVKTKSSFRKELEYREPESQYPEVYQAKVEESERRNVIELEEK